MSRIGGWEPMRVDMDWVRRAFGSQKTETYHAAPIGRHAVVAAILRDSARGAELLLIRRAEYEGDPWSGHMALPGGHGEVHDQSLVQTAVREISEEVGLDLLQHAELLGRLPQMLAHPATLTIFPLVFALTGDQQTAPDPREVQEIVWTTIEHLRSPASSSSYELTVEDRRHRFPAFDVQGHIVWGLTYRIIGDLLSVLGVQGGSQLPEP